MCPLDKVCVFILFLAEQDNITRGTGKKRIRKPTPKQEQLQKERDDKEKLEAAQQKSRRGRKAKAKLEEESNINDVDQSSYSKVAASSVARMLDTVGQSAFMEKLDVSVHVDESQCIRVEGRKRWKCLLCPKMYSSKHNLITHILDHSGIKPHCCMICGKHFKQVKFIMAYYYGILIYYLVMADI